MSFIDIDNNTSTIAMLAGVESRLNAAAAENDMLKSRMDAIQLALDACKAALAAHDTLLSLGVKKTRKIKIVEVAPVVDGVTTVIVEKKKRGPRKTKIVEVAPVVDGVTTIVEKKKRGPRKAKPVSEITETSDTTTQLVAAEKKPRKVKIPVVAAAAEVSTQVEASTPVKAAAAEAAAAEVSVPVKAAAAEAAAETITDGEASDNNNKKKRGPRKAKVVAAEINAVIINTYAVTEPIVVAD